MPHQKTFDDAAAIIDAGVDVADEHYEGIRATEAREMEDRTRREYRNRRNHLYRFWMENYPAYYEAGTRVLGQEEKQNQGLFYHNNDRDIVYQGLDVTLVKAFLVVKKKKRIGSDGKVILLSVSDIKK